MAYHYENLKLEKGMYGRSGRSFSQTLEELDPSEHYRGTPLEGLDAFQRQLKRFDIWVKGAGSDMVEKFFHTTDSAVLFPEFVSRVVRQGLEEESILPDITATVTSFDGMDYRSIAAKAGGEEKELRAVDEGAAIPSTTIKVQANLIKLHKRGRMLVASYESVRYRKLDLFSVTLRQIGSHIAQMLLADGVDVLINGDGNDNAADVFTTAASDTLTYDDLVELEYSLDPAYREGGRCSFMFADATLKAIKKLKDGQGRPLWLPGIDVKEPASILGYRYVINQSVPAMAATAKSVLFGDFSKYIIRDAMGITMYRFADSAFAQKGQVGFLAFMRSGGVLTDAQAVKFFQHGAAA